MELDRNQDDFDDMQLLAAIDRAWPVPPMTGRLMSREWSSMDVTPETGSLAAPLLPGALPRLRPRRPWQSLTRIAAILALMFSGIAAVISFNAHDEKPSSFSIAAPSPGESGCSLPLRSRAELTQIAMELKHQSDTGTRPEFDRPMQSVFDLTPAPSNVAADVNALLAELIKCTYARVNPIALKATDPDSVYIQPYAWYIFDQPNISVDEAVDMMLSPYPADMRISDTSSIPTLSVLMTSSGSTVAVLPSDIFGNAFAYSFSPSGTEWVLESFVGVVTGEWSSLLRVEDSNGLTPTRCTDSMIKSGADMQAEIASAGSAESSTPLIGELQASQLGSQSIGSADEEAIQTLIQNFRDCLANLIEPYRFAQITASFFGAFAEFSHPARKDTPHLLGYSSPIGLFWVTPSDITSIVSLDENTALALLAINPEWKSLGKVPGIVLVKQNGQWLINQLAIVEGSPS